MPKRPVTMLRKGGSVTIAEITGHDAEMAGHDGPKYAHKRLETTALYTHVATEVLRAVISPLDTLPSS
jgi:hypothetical protein